MPLGSAKASTQSHLGCLFLSAPPDCGRVAFLAAGHCYCHHCRQCVLMCNSAHSVALAMRQAAGTLSH
eukprot:5006533-Karenia_brevis.AAC.1